MKDQLLLGAGTVRDRGDVERAIGAGAQFLVSPNVDEKSIQESAGRGMLHIPGVFTPTESQVAFRSGCRLQKLYPANFLGPPYLKAIKAPLDDIDFIPTGGVSESNIGEYIHAGAAAVAVGSTLINARDYTYASLKTKAEHLIERLNIARTESK
jgi:2-dehydro-3-deoxyphosphogluconate aldolase/(4S)-4-hydroxy-2-oxoglutarate aldolase